MISKHLDAEKSALWNHSEVKRVKRFKFLGVHISHQVRKAQQGKLKHAHLPHHQPTNFYQSATESILTYCCTVWFSICTQGNTKDLQRVVMAAECVTGSPLPVLTNIYTDRLQNKASGISKEHLHHGHCFPPLPSGGRYATIKIKTNTEKQLPPWAVMAITLDSQRLTHEIVIT